ncbi:MAG: Hpt domain-containing protein, partial [Candidatus Omnitrophota bacterium]
HLDELCSLLERWLPHCLLQHESGESVQNRPVLPSTFSHPSKQSEEFSPSEPIADSKASPLDLTALDNIRILQTAGEPSILTTVIHNYLNHSQKLIHTLKQASHTTDVKSIEMAAHSLKSSSANVGAIELSSYCKKLEYASRAGSTETLSSWIPKIESEFARVETALQKVLGEEHIHE